MLTIVGWLIVALAVFGGFALAGGHIAVLIQPVEFLIIFGTGIGSLLAGNSLKNLKALGGAIVSSFKGSKHDKELYMQTFDLLFKLFARARKEGLISIEREIEDPSASELFNVAPKVVADAHATDFIADYMRLMISSNLDVHQIDNLMDVEIEAHHEETLLPSTILAKLADSLPAFGIVAAVLGVVHTMESVGVPPAELGKLVAAALVGTFLGILIAYGFVAPLANILEKRAEEGTQYFNCLKSSLIAFMNGYPPLVAVEFGRKTLPSHLRPGFLELEQFVKGNR